MTNSFSWTNPMPYNVENDILPLRDPFILKDGDAWFLTGTPPPYYLSEAPTRTKGVPLYKSTDLLTWTFVDLILKTPDESEGKWYGDCYWAPELFCRNGKYYLTLNCCPANDWKRTKHGHLLACADCIEGPYKVINEDGPLRLGNDAHLFVDDDGQVYLSATGIFLAKFDLDNARFLEKGQMPITPIVGSDAWNGLHERVGMEGPYMLKHNGRYYMFYSTWTRGYDVGVAVADSINGPWHMHPDAMYGAITHERCNEFGGIYVEGYYESQEHCSECGHNCVFVGPDNEPWIAAHFYDYETGGPQLVIDKLAFDDERYLVSVNASGDIVNGPTYGTSTLHYTPTKVTPIKALDVWSYTYFGRDVTLPEQVDILLSNDFRVCAPVTWQSAPMDLSGGWHHIAGTAVYEGVSYDVTAHISVIRESDF